MQPFADRYVGRVVAPLIVILWPSKPVVFDSKSVLSGASRNARSPVVATLTAHKPTRIDRLESN